MTKKVKMKWRGKEAVKIAKKAAMDALRTGGEAILTEAIDEAPVLSGTLRRSGTVTTGALPDFEQVYGAAESGTEQKDAFPDPVGKEDAVYVSFTTPYARRQHEELGYEHPLGGKAKYLERPFNANKKKIIKSVRLRIKSALKQEK